MQTTNKGLEGVKMQIQIIAVVILSVILLGFLIATGVAVFKEA